jgi:hypothetical protein
MTLTVPNNTSEITVAPESKYADDPHCLELLQFFNKHPRTRFSRLVLVHAINNGKLAVVDRALKRLVKDGLVILHSDKIVALYSIAGK